MRSLCLAAGVALAFASLSGCHFFLAPAVIAVTSGVGVASSVASIAKDVLEIDVSVKQLFAPPAASPAAIQ